MSVGILLLSHSYYYSSPILSPTVSSQLDKASFSSDSYLDIVVLDSAEEAGQALHNYTELKLSKSYLNLTLFSCNAHEVYSYSGSRYVLSLSPEIRRDHNVTYNAVFIPVTAFIPSSMPKWLFSYFMSMDIIAINQVIRMFPNQNGNLKEKSSGEEWQWFESHYELYRNTPLYVIIQRIIYAIIAFAMVSVVCAAMTRIGLMASNVAMLILGNACITVIDKCGHLCLRAGLPSQLLYRLAPWLGIYGAYYSRTRRSQASYVCAYLLNLVVIIFFYAICYYVWSLAFFTFGAYTRIQLDNYYLYNQFMEIFIILFCRSQVTILYLPKLLTMINVVFIVYCQSFFFPFINEALSVVIAVSALSLMLFIKLVECPKLALNPFDPLVPSIDHPRQVYIPVLKMNYGLGFDIWTMFYAPGVRSEFDEEAQETMNQALDESMFDFSQNDDRNANNTQELLLPAQEPVLEMPSINNRP
eukprot:TRINITY_DN9660_c0_g1_i1.p1 TRINITY_DN9660_c0_g1~~TRINITY_DN9660_c0_g1_i1.p1  ORF type:complete len:471 (+),score=62.22 TRINITY_DN9660_c0_g1_i1:279-1691(+)